MASVSQLIIQALVVEDCGNSCGCGAGCTVCDCASWIRSVSPNAAEPPTATSNT
jgi:hypothetical protein